MSCFERSVELPVSAAEAYAWHARPGAFERLFPPWEQVRVVRRTGDLACGQVELRMRVAGWPQTWLAELYQAEPGVVFRDRQLRGPFAAWDHEHRFEPRGAGASRLTDRIEYRPPLGLVGQLLGGGTIRGMLARMFRYRHDLTAGDLAHHARYAARPRLTVGITGATGLVGSALAALLSTGGHQPVQLARAGSRSAPLSFCPHLGWTPATGQLDLGSTQLDAVVHLAGENIAGRRWTAAVKKEIARSRVESTRKLAESLARLPQPPKTLVCASAIGFYGDRGEEPLDEQATSGNGFLAQVCRDWEAATEPARAAGMRVVNARVGVVLARRGGALAAMLTPFQMGGGGVVGSGKQYWSWIALDDVIGGLDHALHEQSIAGPLNLTAPNPATNRDFTHALGKVLFRPTLAPLPGFAARLALGEMADELLLASIRVLPQRLAQTGYVFRYPELEPALRHALGKW